MTIDGITLIFMLLALVGIFILPIKYIIENLRRTPKEKVIEKVLRKHLFKKYDFDEIVDDIKKGYQQVEKNEKLKIRKQKLRRLKKIG